MLTRFLWSSGGWECGSADDAEDVFFAHDQVVLADVLDLGAGVGSEEHGVDGLDREGRALAVVERAAFADRDDAAFLGLVLGALGQQDPAGGLGLGFGALDQHAVAQRADAAGVLVGGG